jgi:hypothetical protein
MTAREQILAMYAGVWLAGCWGTYAVVMVVRRVHRKK